MIRFLLLITLLPFISSKLFAQDFEWAIKQSGTDFESVFQVAEDTAGNIYEIGSFWGLVDFNPSTATFFLTSAGLTDNFICKLDPTGGFEWAKRVGSTGSESGTNICIGGNNTVYTGGKFQNTVDFDPSPATHNLVSAGIDDAFIAAYSTNGNYGWAAKFGGTGTDYITGLTEKDGFIYATGYFQGTVDFNPGTGIYNLTATGPDATFILKLDDNGNFVWAKSISGSSSTLSFDLDVDDLGNVITGGEFWGTCDFDPGNGTQSMSAFAFGSDAFLLQLDADGNYGWVDVFSGEQDEWVNSIDIGNNGSIGVSGVFQGTMDFDPGSGTFNLISHGGYDLFALRLHGGDGSLQWAVSAGGTFNEQAGELDVASYGDYYISGAFSGTVDFDPGAGVFNLTDPGISSIFCLRLDSGGNFVNAYGFGSTLSSSMGHSIHADDEGRITLAGAFEQTIDFNPGTPVFNLASSLGTSDCFVQQMSVCLTRYAEVNTAICSGDSIFAGGAYQKTPGTYIDNLLTPKGCDSIVTTNLSVLPNSVTLLTDTFCEGDVYLFQGSVLDSAGIYTAHLPAANGCDSAITLSLGMYQRYDVIVYDSICEGSTYLFNGLEITEAGTYTADLFAITGCDSTVTLVLSMLPGYDTLLEATICEGSTYFFNGAEISTEGTYVAQLHSVNGCDSTITLTLQVLPLQLTEFYDSICEGETILFNGMELDAGGDYSFTVAGSNGCDSTVTLHITATVINASVTISNDTLFATGNGSVQWIFCESGLPVPDADQPVFVPGFAGNFAAVFTNGNCTDTTACSYYTALPEQQHDFHVALFPNPASEKVTLWLRNYTGPVNLTLRNVIGEVLLQTEFISKTEISLQQVPAGLYFLYLSGNGMKAMEKLVIEQ